MFARTDSKLKKKKVIAVLHFSANNTPASLGRIIQNNLELYIFKTGKFEVLERNQINVILKERNIQEKRCKNKNCAATLGKVLNTNYTIIGSIDKLNDYTINIKVVDTVRRKVVVVETEPLKDLNVLLKKLKHISKRLSEKVYEIDRIKTFFDYYPLSIGARFDIAMPVGYFSDIVSTGFGVSIDASLQNVLFKQSIIVLSYGYYNFDGKNDGIHQALMMPVLFSAGYIFKIEPISITPVIGFGVSYNTNSYYTHKSGNKYNERSLIQPLLSFEIKFQYSLNNAFFVQMIPRYAMIFEKDTNIMYASSAFAVGFTF